MYRGIVGTVPSRTERRGRIEVQLNSSSVHVLEGVEGVEGEVRSRREKRGV